jgi:hypothetical protein
MIKNEPNSRNEIVGLSNNKSKKSLSPTGNYSMPQVIQNRRQSGNYPNDLNKIYLVQGSGSEVGPGIQYQKRVMAGHSPSNAEIGVVAGMPLQGGGYFHQRNQSMDVGVLQQKK